MNFLRRYATPAAALLATMTLSSAHPARAAERSISAGTPVSGARATVRTADPRALVADAIRAVSGTGSLDNVHAIRVSGIQHEYALGNAERAEGPWRVFYSTFDELRDADHHNVRRTERFLGGALSGDRVTIISDTIAASLGGGREIIGSPASYELFQDRIAATPDRALRLAAASQQLTLETRVNHYGIPFDVVSFPWRDGRMRIEISTVTHFPAAIETTRTYPQDFRWGIFGDVIVRTEMLDWNVQDNGVWWPMQLEVFFNGQPLRDVTYSTVALAQNVVAPDSFAVSDSTRAKWANAMKAGLGAMRVGTRGAPTEPRPGIVRIPDQWAMTMVRQDDGVVIFETHISAEWLDGVIAEANRRYPGAPIKAIVMTSDPWAHLGGFRQAVARGIPIYAKDASIPFLMNLAKTPHTLQPDLLARTHRAPRLIPVSRKTVIGTGTNAIELYPVGGEYAERMLMAYLPGQKLLYGADLIFPARGPDGKVQPGFSVTPATDLRSAILREKLDVQAIFCVQNYPLFDGPAFMRNESKPLPNN